MGNKIKLEFTKQMIVTKLHIKQNTASRGTAEYKLNK